MVARSHAVIDDLARELGDATAVASDVADLDRWQETIRGIIATHGMPDRVVYNTEGGGWGTLADMEVEQFAAGFAVNVVGFFVLAKALQGGDASVLITSSPAAYHPAPMFLGIGPNRAAQRMLADTLNQMDVSLRCCVLSIDGAIDEPGMRAVYPNKPHDFFVQPEAIADKINSLFDAKPWQTQARISAEGAASGIRLR